MGKGPLPAAYFRNYCSADDGNGGMCGAEGAPNDPSAYCADHKPKRTIAPSLGGSAPAADPSNLDARLSALEALISRVASPPKAGGSG